MSALTPEEWGRVENGQAVADSITIAGDTVTWVNRHGFAALALHGQPYGFTHEDVRMLRNLEVYAPFLVGEGAANLADRIEALLPPRE